ncbi:hypothetical protein BC628DRAFT_988740 [Trametes gibbosa]|nr:hypothetical protein BC628DRAFT_988740 [Trametes gibbosa]
MGARGLGPDTYTALPCRRAPFTPRPPSRPPSSAPMSTLRRRAPPSTSRSESPIPSAPTPPAYILFNTVTHARLLPHSATHAFSYPTLAFLLPLDALEAGALDLARGWLFGYGGTAGRLTGLRAGAYLLPGGPCSTLSEDGRDERGAGAGGSTGGGGGGGGGQTLKEKLAAVLVRQGCDAASVRGWAGAGGEAWMVSMPSYVGYEGVNPLTVYFCYAAGGALAWVVLEIHNTFGEKHVHVLERGTGEDSDGPARVCCSYDHTWTIARDFHVSPFNDRAGFYTVSIVAPPPPSSPLLATKPPRVKVRIHLRTPTTLPSDTETAAPAVVPDKLKLTATFFTRRAIPLTSPNLLRALAQYPFALLLSLARILYHAWILHYIKRLDVFPRPDPKPATSGWFSLHTRDSPCTGPAPARTYGGIGWQPEGALEAYSRRRVERLLARRGAELGTHIELVPGDPSIPRQLFGPPCDVQKRSGRGEAALAIHYAAPRFFSTLLLAPSPEHALLTARAEDLFRTNSDSLFCSVFSGNSLNAGFEKKASFTQRARTALLPQHFLAAEPSGVLATNPLDDDAPFLNVLVICALHLLDRLEKAVFALFRARFVPGMEPWMRWERAADVAEQRPLRR